MKFEQYDNITVYGEYNYPAQDTSIPEIANKFLPSIRAGYIEKTWFFNPIEAESCLFFLFWPSFTLNSNI